MKYKKCKKCLKELDERIKKFIKDWRQGLKEDWINDKKEEYDRGWKDGGNFILDKLKELKFAQG